MRLWTIQTIDFYEELNENKIITVKQSYTEKNFIDSYNWMIEKMVQKIGNRSENNFPIWAWYQYQSKQKRKPDLRHSVFFPKGTKGVRIEIEKDQKDVVLSDFELWHYPLNKWFIGENEKSAIAFENEISKLGLNQFKFDSYPQKIKLKIIESWDKIFDLKFDDPYYTQPENDKCLQATFWEIRKEEIINVDFFTAR